MRRNFCYLLVLLFPVIGVAQGQRYLGPELLGPFRIDKDVTMRTLFDELGKPLSVKGDVFCYKTKDGRAFLTVTRMAATYDETIAGTATLSSFPNCINQSVEPTSDNLTAWKTEKGIGLSSSADDVRRAYGSPSKEDRIEGTKYRWVIHGSSLDNHYGAKERRELGETVLIYEGASKDLRIAEFGIRKGKVVWISLSKNE